MCGDGIAVRPKRVGAQMESVGQTVGRTFPVFRDSRHGAQVFGVFTDQSFEQSRKHVVVGGAGRQVGIQIGQGGTLAAM